MIVRRSPRLDEIDTSGADGMAVHGAPAYGERGNAVLGGWMREVSASPKFPHLDGITGENRVRNES